MSEPLPSGPSRGEPFRGGPRVRFTWYWDDGTELTPEQVKQAEIAFPYRVPITRGDLADALDAFAALHHLPQRRT